MNNLRITNFGHIKEADINFGDLTLFVGPQATGKSILLQLLKLLLDHRKIVFKLHNYGYDFPSDSSSFLELYFGEGMNTIWRGNTKICWNQKVMQLENLIDIRKIVDELEEDLIFLKNENLFIIPAQRVITLANGWPRPFLSFDVVDPYVVRDFSEQLRIIMQKTYFISEQEKIFPNSRHLTRDINLKITKSIFHGASVALKTAGMRKQIYIEIEGNSLPFMVWSAGQREFMPLLLSFYWLTYITKQNSRAVNSTKSLEFVVIEEPEMGLHPQAILSVILMCLELLNQGYKLIISTHSPVLLEAVWAIRFLQTNNPNVQYLYQLFDMKTSKKMDNLLMNILKNKAFLTYYFDQQDNGVYVKDISTLYPGDLDEAISEWGGLTSFSSRASDVVSQAAQEKQ